MPVSQYPIPNTQCPTRHRRVAIDLVPIRVGEGGTGSGIWTYARELLLAMDRSEVHELEILALVNEGQVPFLSDLKHIRLVRFRGGGKSIIRRLFWVHLQLPLHCLFRRVDVLHKLATDTPLFCHSKRVTTIHDFYYEFLMEQRSRESIRLYERVESAYFSMVTKACFKKSNAIITVSNATREEAVRRYPGSKDRIAVIHHGAPYLQPIADSRQPRAKESSALPSSTINHQSSTDIKRDAFNILCVAKFMEHKGQHLLLKAFERLLAEHPECADTTRLTLRGFHNDSDYYEAICRKINDSRYASNIDLVAFDPKDTIGDIYRNADLVVLLSGYEGFGLPVLEAQSMGVPVLCSDLPVLREVGGDGAVYVARDDIERVARAMHRFIFDVDYYDALRNEASGNIQRFSWNLAAEKTLNAYAICFA